MPALADIGGLGRELSNWLFPGFIVLLVVSAICLHRFGMLAGNDSSVRAVFLSTNAATLTGFPETPGVSSLNLAGECIILLLIVAGSLFSMTVGSMAIKRICRLPWTDGQVLRATLIAQAGALAIATPLLYRGNVLHAMVLAASAFGNCALTLDVLPSGNSWATHLVILPLTVLGGLGLIVLMDIAGSLMRRQPLSPHSRAVLGMTAWIYVLGFVLLFLLDVGAATRHDWHAIKAAAATASVLSLESRTGGLPIVQTNTTSQAMQAVLMLLMIVGASPGGTGSGLKTTTLAELIRGTAALVKGRPVRRGLGIAMTWLLVYGLLVIASAILLSYVKAGGNSDGILFNSISAASNVGWSAAQLPDTKNVLFAYCAIMLLGRTIPLMVIWWMAESTTSDWAIG